MKIPFLDVSEEMVATIKHHPVYKNPTLEEVKDCFEETQTQILNTLYRDGNIPYVPFFLRFYINTDEDIYISTSDVLHEDLLRKLRSQDAYFDQAKTLAIGYIHYKNGVAQVQLGAIGDLPPGSQKRSEVRQLIYSKLYHNKQLRVRIDSRLRPYL